MAIPVGVAESVRMAIPEGVAEEVASRAAAAPEALAVAAGERRLSYGELDARAERLAARLRSLGVGPETVVGLCLVSSPALIVGALGILKAGAAYLPLDPAYPADRLALVLDDAKPPVLVTAACLAEQLPSGAWAVIGLGQDGLAGGPDVACVPPLRATADTLAYVIYTSGSTGRPKGVEITSRSLSNLVSWHRHAFSITPEDRATQIAGVGFDASVWEMWPYLTAGASLHVPPEGVRQDPEALRDWLVSERITRTFLPTPLAERLLGLDWPAGTALRTLLTGADTLHRHPPPGLPFALVNNYGPTECTVVATSGVVPPGGGSELPTIGMPIDNVEAHILDEQLRPMPPGAAGELYIGGEGLARGYLNRPDLTAQRFVRHPFSAERGARLYKTGDLARRRPDGQIVFLGRLDEQIKVRGYRIEPAEIVAVLDEHPAVRESAVAACETSPGDKRLVAYVVLGVGAQPTYGALRDFLAARLPDYMLPASFVVLEALPLTHSGKLDRERLPRPEDAAVLLEGEAMVLPRTPVEECVAKVLAPLLGLERVGVLDNFFMLGGHSMLGTQLIARLRAIFSVELALRTLFERPTVAGLAAEIEHRLRDKLEAMSEEEAEQLSRRAEEAHSGLRPS